LTEVHDAYLKKYNEEPGMSLFTVLERKAAGPGAPQVTLGGESSREDYSDDDDVGESPMGRHDDDTSDLETSNESESDSELVRALAPSQLDDVVAIIAGATAKDRPRRRKANVVLSYSEKHQQERYTAVGQYS
jgi:hypothetical protein